MIEPNVSNTVPDPAARAFLDELVRSRGLTRFAYFLVTGEGEIFPNGMEAASGYVIDSEGRVYRFWTAWDSVQDKPTFRVWRQEEYDQRWERRSAYRRARQAVGLS